jgi:hypothetical protein
MRLPCLAALTLLPACFTDPGTNTTDAATTTSSSSAAASSSGAPTTGDDPGTSNPSTSTTSSSSSTSTSDPTTTGDATTGAPQGLDCAVTPCFNVINNCSGPLTIRAANDKTVLEPVNVVLAPGAAQQYVVPAEWPAGRINAFWLDPDKDPQAHDKVEVTVGSGVMNYNITYVDWVALPVEMTAVGPACTPSQDFDPKVGCYVPRDQLLEGCPDELRSGDRCLSAGIYCSDPAHQDLPYCHALDELIALCADFFPETCGVAAKLGNSTRDVYACTGYFDSQPPNCAPASTDCHLEGNKWCAALNRNMLGDPDSTDTDAYYKQPPFNTYAQWVHATCPGIYAFPYDDYPSNAGESGFRACTADRLDVTFCPAG